ncbi:alpha/beta hydrolase [Streptomyces sp. NBC_01136]|uniref:alpha/beta fold hydrolase n=1 Tax=unclassified Streptomyces TaxID=2593676 RepID=UPI0032554FE1|nr:alpha/beta hydrolase [Streptomyces sp. NBC_01136]
MFARHIRAHWQGFVLGLVAVVTAALLPLAAGSPASAAPPQHRSGTAAPDSPSVSGDPANPRPPRGFTSHMADVNGIRMHYVMGGHGPTLVLLHGYPETWYEWHQVMPVLGEHYTVIAPDLRGSGASSAPATGYDKKTLAADVHALLVSLHRAEYVNLVGHDIGTMVAYAYAADYRGTVSHLALTEAPIPDSIVYTYPSLTSNGPGFWNFGFFSLTNGLPEATIHGHEKKWVAGFMDWLTVNKAAEDPRDVAVYAAALRDPAHLKASFEYFRAFHTDNVDVAAQGRTKLTVPVLALGGAGSLGNSVADQVRHYATNVTGAVIAGSGHWIWEEQPQRTTASLLSFLAR